MIPSTTDISTLSLHDALPILDELLHGEHERLGQLAMRAGGHVAAVTGGSLLIAFGYPSAREDDARGAVRTALRDRKSTRLNSSHANISYAVFCLKKKKLSSSS